MAQSVQCQFFVKFISDVSSAHQQKPPWQLSGALAHHDEES